MTNSFDPDWTVPPGELIREAMYERGLRQIDFAALVGLSQQNLSRLVIGKAHLAPAVALKLEELGVGTAEFWVTADARYWLDLARGRKAMRPVAAPRVRNNELSPPARKNELER